MNKMVILNKIVQFPRQHKKICLGAILVLAFLVSFGVFLIIFAPKAQVDDTPTEPKRYSSPTIITEQAELKIQENSPSDGPLQSEKVATYFGTEGSSPKFIYFTNERRNERLIALTDQIIADLTASGQITDKTDSYTIDYFNDKTIAKTYFQKVNDPKTTTEEKLKLKVSYIATLAYVKSLRFNQLIRISTATIIKSF